MGGCWCGTALGGGHPGERKTPKAERAKVTHIRSEITAQDLANAGHPQSIWPAVPGDPVWQDQPAGRLPEPPDIEDQPGTVSPQQQRAIHAACTGMDRAKRLATIGDIVGRQVTSSNELSYTEAARVLADPRFKTKAAAK